MILYTDASFMAKLLVDEDESESTAASVEEMLARGDQLVSSRIIVTELHRLAFRIGARRLDVNAVLDVLTLTNPDTDIFLNAGLIPHQVKTLDAIHVATALRVHAEHFLTFDRQQASAAEAMGVVAGPEMGRRGQDP